MVLGDDLAPVQYQAITCTKDELLSIDPFRTENFNGNALENIISAKVFIVV